MNEHQQKEVKQIWKDDYLKVICSFANAKGGLLEIGFFVTDDDLRYQDEVHSNLFA